MITKIVEASTKQNFEVSLTKNGENDIPCPACSDLHPKNAKRKCLRYNAQLGTGKCYRCQATFVTWKEFEPTKQEYVLPPVEVKTELIGEHLTYFHKRMISNEALNFCGVYSKSEFMPQLERQAPVVCFPFKFEGKVVNIKFRGPKKSFKLVKGAEKILWQLDEVKGKPMVVITEGEIDALSYVTAGIKFVCSVPNGAGNNLDYLNDYMHLFDKTEVIILAVDTDSAGQELRKELARRFGPERCKIVDYRGLKDANEFLVKFGAPDLFRTIEEAKDYPVSGIFGPKDIESKIHDLWVTGLQPGRTIGFEALDKLVTWEEGRLCVLTGIPGHGKSELLDFVITRLSLIWGWKAAFFSPENVPTQIHHAKIVEKLIGKKFSANDMTETEYLTAFQFVNNTYRWIVPDPEEDEDWNLDLILAKAKFLVRRLGVKVLVIDPYNKLEHRRDGKSETDYISFFLDKLINFGVRNGCLVFLVAHPAKLQQEKGKIRIPTLYDISGSAHFFNKTDYGVTVYRSGGQDGLLNLVTVYVQKVKFRHLGKTGSAKFIYNSKNGRYAAESAAGIDAFDDSNWLLPKEETAIPF